MLRGDGTIHTDIRRCVYRASYCSVLMNNEMHSSYNQFYSTVFLSALHVSNKSSRSSSAARHNILYYTVWYNRAVSTTVPIVPHCVIQYIMPCC